MRILQDSLGFLWTLPWRRYNRIRCGSRQLFPSAVVEAGEDVWLCRHPRDLSTFATPPVVAMLYRPWLIPLVVLFWCASSGWLLLAKILPTLSPGSPPGYQALYMAENRLVPVAWTVLWNDQPLGWAMSQSATYCLAAFMST